jgi:Prolipoprotein diacylglyceryl transferase
VPWGLEIFYRRDSSGYMDPHSLDGVSTGQVAAVVQPTFLYELIWNVLVFVALIYIDRRFRLGHGRLFAVYVAGYCIGRFCVELLRDDTATHIAGIRINSFTSTFVFIGAVVYIMAAPKGREDPASLRGTDYVDDEQPEPEPEPAEAEAAAAEAPAVEEAAEEPAAEAAEEPEAEAAEEPAAEEPEVEAAEEPAAEAPAVEEPEAEAAEEPAADEPATEDQPEADEEQAEQSGEDAEPESDTEVKPDEPEAAEEEAPLGDDDGATRRRWGRRRRSSKAQ